MKRAFSGYRMMVVAHAPILVNVILCLIFWSHVVVNCSAGGIRFLIDDLLQVAVARCLEDWEMLSSMSSDGPSRLA